jgi:hypothetical protein
MENQTELKWHQKPTGVIIFLIIFFPVGLYLMWKYELWTKQTRWIVTGLVAVLVIANDGKNKNTSETNKETTVNVDVCRCLTEPGNSDWSKTNKDACRDAISKEIGVDNWEKVNFSQNPELNRKFDELTQKCTGSTEVKTGIEDIDKNNTIVKYIGTSYGYVWESINNDAQIYTTLAFDGLIFRSTVYTMNGKTNSENFTKVIGLSGKWSAKNPYSAEGIIEQNNVPVAWTFSENYSSLQNNKGVTFNRIKVK